MADQLDELEIAFAVARSKAWMTRLIPGQVLDEQSGFCADDLFALSYAISMQNPAVAENPNGEATSRAVVFKSPKRIQAA